jgi:hypothetical protein
VKEWAEKRWKFLALMVFAFALYGLDKFAPQLELERRLVDTLRVIVEQMPE